MYTESKCEQLEFKILEFEKEVTEWKRSEKSLLKRVDELGECIKELNCLYAISLLVEQTNMPLDDTIRGVISLIPSAFRYPEMTCARVLLETQEFRTENFRETGLKEATDVTVEGACVGRVEVCLFERGTRGDVVNYLKQKKRHIKAVAERVGRIIGQWKAEQLTLGCFFLPEDMTD